MALALVLGLTAAAPRTAKAQIVASAAVGWPAAASNPHLADFSAHAQVGVALPPVPHTLLLWNLAGIGFDRLQRRDGVALTTGLELWLSPAMRPVGSHSPLLLGEASLGRRFGMGLHGFTTLGAGFGWSLGDWVPYVEYRRRANFHDSFSRRELLVGLHFVLFG